MIKRTMSGCLMMMSGSDVCFLSSKSYVELFALGGQNLVNYLLHVCSISNFSSVYDLS